MCPNLQFANIYARFWWPTTEKNNGKAYIEYSYCICFQFSRESSRWFWRRLQPAADPMNQMHVSSEQNEPKQLDNARITMTVKRIAGSSVSNERRFLFKYKMQFSLFVSSLRLLRQCSRDKVNEATELDPFPNHRRRACESKTLLFYCVFWYALIWSRVHLTQIGKQTRYSSSRRFM